MTELAERTYDAIFTSRLGLAAKYLEGANSTDCRVLRFDPDAQRQPTAGLSLGSQGFGIAERRRFLLVRAKEVEAPQAGAAFSIQVGAGPLVTWRIGEDHPIAHDDAGFVWRCAVVRE